MRDHYDARYPFLFVQTTEEERLIRENREKFGEDVQFFCWDIAAGFRQMVKLDDGGWAWISLQDQKDPAAALAMAASSPENSILFFKDFHEYWAKISVVRATLNIKNDLIAGKKTVVFVSAVKQIPPGLANDIKVLDFEYPDEESLRGILVKSSVANQEPLPKDENQISAMVNALRGLTWDGAESALAYSIVKTGKFDIRTLLDQKASQFKASGALEFGTFEEKLEDLYGLDVMKDYVCRTVGNQKARGILIYGVPGTGKSHFAKGVSNWKGWPCFILRFSALKDKYQGVAESKLRDAFKTIRAAAQCIVFLDEIEAIASGISSGGDSGVGMNLYKDLLIEMEDSRGCGAYWVGTCNDLDPLIHESGGAILRRFNSIFFADMPSAEEAKGIAQIWGKKEGVSIPEDFDLDGYSGADIAKLAEEMSMQGITAEEARKYILPYGKAHKDQLEAIRKKAEGVCIWASPRQDNKPAIQRQAMRQVKRPT